MNPFSIPIAKTSAPRGGGPPIDALGVSTGDPGAELDAAAGDKVGEAKRFRELRDLQCARTATWTVLMLLTLTVLGGLLPAGSGVPNATLQWEWTRWYLVVPILLALVVTSRMPALTAWFPALLAGGLAWVGAAAALCTAPLMQMMGTSDLALCLVLMFILTAARLPVMFAAISAAVVWCVYALALGHAAADATAQWSAHAHVGATVAIGAVVAALAEVAMRRELTLLSQMAEGRRRSERYSASRARFIAAASHDLRQPLHAMTFLSRALRDRLQGDPIEATLRRLEQAAQTTDSMFQDLLELSRIDAGASTLHIEPVRLNRVFENLQSEFLESARAKGIKLQLYKTDLVCLSDAVALQRILSNLVSNAIRYTDVGQVLVKASTDGKLVRIHVRDTGPGIAREHHGAIFEEFRQLQKDRGGSGLGLAIAKRLADALSHRLDVESEVGDGSRFSITVPRAIEEIAPRPATIKQPLEGSFVLLVDDDREIRRAVRPMIESWGCTVVDAASGKDAEEKLSHLLTVPDLMIVDHDLRNGETSDAVIERINELYGQEIPSLIVSGNTQAQQRGSAMLKPVDPGALRSALEKARRKN